MVIIIFIWPNFQRQQYKGRDAGVLNKPHRQRRRRRVYYYFPDVTFNLAAKDWYRVCTHDIGGGKK